MQPDLSDQLNEHAKKCNVSASEYIRALLDNFAGMTSDEIDGLLERRADRVIRVHELTAQVSGLELAISKLETIEYELQREAGVISE